jgi:hypothetical protein
MILSFASTKDLIRSLAVSKHWQRSILGSTALRRKLFLDPEPKTEYFSIKFSVFHRERNDTSRSIHEPHPMLLSYISPTARTCLQVNEIPTESFRTIHPETLLFQPPLDRIQVDCSRHEVLTLLTSTDGVTFGDVVEGLDKICTRRLYGDGGDGHTCSMIHCRALASNAEVVLGAREVRAKAEASSGFK